MVLLLGGLLTVRLIWVVALPVLPGLTSETLEGFHALTLPVRVAAVAGHVSLGLFARFVFLGLAVMAELLLLLGSLSTEALVWVVALPVLPGITTETFEGVHAISLPLIAATRALDLPLALLPLLIIVVLEALL